MGHPDGMYIGLLVVAGVALLAWRWQAVKSWAERVAWRPYREAGLLVGLLILAFCVVSLLTSNSPWAATVVVPVTVWLIFCAPQTVRRLAPVALVVGGVVGVALTASRVSAPATNAGPGQGGWASAVAARMIRWAGGRSATSTWCSDARRQTACFRSSGAGSSSAHTAQDVSVWRGRAASLLRVLNPQIR